MLSPVKVYQITDLHLFAEPEKTLLGLNTQQSFLAVLDSARTAPEEPDLILLTGDLAQDEALPTYQRLTESLKGCFSCPIYWIPGNHDNLAYMQETLATDWIKTDKQILCQDWQIILLNSQIPGKEVEGYLAKTELAFLEKCLTDYPSHHTLIAMHHHPLPLDCPWLDNINITNAKELLQVLDAHEQVKGVIWGHVHQAFATTRNGIPFLASPSTSIQFKPGSQDFSLDPVEPGYRYLELLPGGKINTEVRRLHGDCFTATLNMDAQGY